MPLNKGQIYEEKIRNKLRSKKLLPVDLRDNDAGFIYKGKPCFVEVKNKTAPDFGQRGLVWNKNSRIWTWRKNDVITQLYDGYGIKKHIDKNFTPRRYSIEPIEQISKKDKEFDQQNFKNKDSGIPMLNTFVLYEFYALKQCFYIQIEGKGLYYLKKDAADLGVPQFNLPLTLRLRAKTHESLPIYNYSFFAVIQAKTNNLVKSPCDFEEIVGKFPAITK